MHNRLQRGPISKKPYIKVSRRTMNNALIEQTSTHKPTLLEELEIAMTVAEGLTRYAFTHDQAELWYRSWKRELELAEQIALIKDVVGAPA